MNISLFTVAIQENLENGFKFFSFFQQNPLWLENVLTRLDYFITSFSANLDLYKFTDEINAQINTFSDKLQLTAILNGKNATVPNLPLWLNRNFDAKFNRPEQLAFSLGTARKFQQ